MSEIRTERLLLRNIEKDDKADIFEYSSSPEVGLNAGWKPHESLSETEELMDAVFVSEKGVFGLILPESGKLIGTAGLIADPKRDYDKAFMLGYALGKPYWNRGYMTEAARAILKYGFEKLGAEVISVYCYPENVASIRVIENCGFKYEGKMRMAEKRFDGEIMDNLIYSMTKFEFLNEIVL